MGGGLGAGGKQTGGGEACSFRTGTGAHCRRPRGTCLPPPAGAARTLWSCPSARAPPGSTPGRGEGRGRGGGAGQGRGLDGWRMGAAASKRYKRGIDSMRDTGAATHPKLRPAWQAAPRCCLGQHAHQPPTSASLAPAACSLATAREYTLSRATRSNLSASLAGTPYLQKGGGAGHGPWSSTCAVRYPPGACFRWRQAASGPRRRPKRSCPARGPGRLPAPPCLGRPQVLVVDGEDEVILHVPGAAGGGRWLITIEYCCQRVSF